MRKLPLHFFGISYPYRNQSIAKAVEFIPLYMYSTTIQFKLHCVMYHCTKAVAYIKKQKYEPNRDRSEVLVT